MAAPPPKNSFNNPAYYVLEGVPHQLLPPEPPSPARAPVPPATKNKVAITVPAPQLGRHRPPRVGEGSSSDEESGGTLPPPDFPPPPLPDSAIFLPPSREPLPGPGVRGRSGGEARALPPPKAHPRPPLPPGPLPPGTFLGEAAGGDDRSCSVLQVAKKLSEVDSAPPGPGRCLLLPGPLELQPARALPSDYGRPLSFPPPRIRESVQEDLAEEVRGGRRLCVPEACACPWSGPPGTSPGSARGGGGVPSAPGRGGDGHRTGPTPGLCLHPEHVGACGCLRVRLGGPSRTPPNTPSSLRLRARRPGGPVGWARRAWAPGCGPSAWSATRRAWCTTAGTTWSFSGGGRAGGGRGGGVSGLQSRAVGPGGPLGPSPSLSYPYSDITEEDLEEAGVQDPAHKRLLLDTLQLSK